MKQIIEKKINKQIKKNQTNMKGIRKLHLHTVHAQSLCTGTNIFFKM